MDDNLRRLAVHRADAVDQLHRKRGRSGLLRDKEIAHVLVLAVAAEPLVHIDILLRADLKDALILDLKFQQTGDVNGRPFST